MEDTNWSEPKYEAQEFNADGFIELWKQTIGDGTKVVKEKFTYEDGILNHEKSEREVVENMESTKFPDDVVVVSWKGVIPKTVPRLLINNTFSVGVEEHDGKKSVIVSQSKVDLETGRNILRIRRFTAVTQ